MKRQNKIINDLEIAIKDQAVRRLYLESLLNGFTNQLGFDCIQFQDEKRGIHINIDVDPLCKLNGSYVAEIKTKAGGSERFYYALNTFSIIDFLRNKPQKQIKK